MAGLLRNIIRAVAGQRSDNNPRSHGGSDGASTEVYRIDFEMMLKGSVYKRRSGTVRQFGVTVGGSTHLVTSGDTVDRATYEALVAAGAIRVPPEDLHALPPRRHDRAVTDFED